jgi:ATP-dependent DNA helicase RecG
LGKRLPYKTKFVTKEIIVSSQNILQHPIEYLKGVGPQRGELLKKELGIFTFNDLLHHFPYRHQDRTSITDIGQLSTAIEFAQVKGKLVFHETIVEKNSKRLVA